MIFEVLRSVNKDQYALVINGEKFVQPNFVRPMVCIASGWVRSWEEAKVVYEELIGT